MNLQITENFLSDKIATLALIGRINAVTAPDLKTKLKHLVEDGYVMLIVDLTAVSFIDSSGLAALVSGFKAAKENGGTIKLFGLSDQTRTVFKLTKLDTVFEIYSDSKTALDTLPTS